MKGFLVGSLTLIVLYVLLQPKAADTATSASNTALAGFNRILASGIAGVPNKAKSNPSQKPSSAPATSSTPTPVSTQNATTTNPILSA